MAETLESGKRDSNAADLNNEDDEWIGPMPAEAVKTKKRKVLEFEKVYLDNLPSAQYYEKSFMHRDVITHLAVSKSDFIVTASCDGHVKFWKKKEEEGIEFVKHFRSHLGNIQDLGMSPNGEFCCTISDDKSAKVFDVVNFDMINMMKLTFNPLCCGWLFKAGDPLAALAISDKDSGCIYIYDGRGGNDPIHKIEKLHYKPVIIMKYNVQYNVTVSVDKCGMLEYWTGPQRDYSFPKNVDWEHKTDTDLYEFAKLKISVFDICFSPDGKLFATVSSDRKVRVFKFLTGKLSKVLDESLQQFTELQQMKQQLPNMEFGRRLAAERDLEKSEAFHLCNIIFDESGNFILYGTMLGIKVINLHTNRCVRMIGKPENIRSLSISLFQGTGKKKKAAIDVETAASDNPTLQNVFFDPLLFCTAFKKNRFYIYSRREPEDTKSIDSERDVFNEKPSKEEIVSSAQDASYTRVAESCIMYTTMGDIHLKLFAKECPKTVENFCVHSRDGYYNGHIVHRVIKNFMIQTGDPQGNGTGGESIWGGEFEDEFHPSLRHDRPYTLSMANAGPNTNGSQFFITLVPTPWLDNKHTVFGRVTRGMDVVQNLGNVKTNSKTDKPLDDIRIINIAIK
ncbi:PPWD1 [Mytilus edulis]|uniref:peptidylprolyl isomerase n=2 Tax=Mytilus TaxID=6548 RepID=A0A8S3RLA7_MYTED|nr:PPWD1 [Mytilus edulis]